MPVTTRRQSAMPSTTPLKTPASPLTSPRVKTPVAKRSTPTPAKAAPTPKSKSKAKAVDGWGGNDGTGAAVRGSTWAARALSHLGILLLLGVTPPFVIVLCVAPLSPPLTHPLHLPSACTCGPHSVPVLSASRRGGWRSRGPLKWDLRLSALEAAWVVLADGSGARETTAIRSVFAQPNSLPPVAPTPDPQMLSLPLASDRVERRLGAEGGASIPAGHGDQPPSLAPPVLTALPQQPAPPPPKSSSWVVFGGGDLSCGRVDIWTFGQLDTRHLPG